MFNFIKNIRKKVAEYNKRPEDYYSVSYFDGKIIVSDGYDNSEKYVYFNDIKEIKKGLPVLQAARISGWYYSLIRLKNAGISRSTFA